MRSNEDRLRDVLAACEAIESHLLRGDTDDDMVFDAIRIRLLEIGEAVKDISPELLVKEPLVPWTAIARMRDQLAHRYFDTAHSIVDSTARRDIPALKAAVERLLS